MYIIRVENLDRSKVEYFRAQNMTDAKLFQSQSMNYVDVFTSREFLEKLPLIQVQRKPKSNFDVIW